MRTLFLIFALLLTSLPLSAQQGNTVLILFSGVPSGTCSYNMLGVDGSNGDLYDCLSGAWNAVGGAGGAPVGAEYLVLTLDGTLTNERNLTIGVGIGFTDGGANGAFNIFLDNLELTANQTFWTGVSPTRTITFSLSGATDPVFNFGDNLFNVTNAVIQQGGDDVIHKSTNTLLSTENVILDGSTNPRDITLGILRILQTPNVDSTRGIAIITDAAGFGDAKALEIAWTATGVVAGDFESVINIDIDTADSSGGNIIALTVSETTTGSAVAYGMLTGIGINPIFNEAGSFGNVETAFTFDSVFTDVTADFNSTGSDVQMFVSNGDLVYIGMAAMFDEVEFILAITASNPGVKPTFEYSDGASGWLPFSPTDGTNGMRQNGDLVWIASNLAGWVQDTVNGVSGKFWIRIIRGAGSISPPPTEDLVQVASDVDYKWDSGGNLNVASVSSGFNTEIADAGFIRCQNNETCMAWEANTPGGDLTLIVDAFDILQFNGTFNATTLTESSNAVPNATDTLDFFAATTSAEFLGIISNETGTTGLVVASINPTLTDVTIDDLLTFTETAGDDTCGAGDYWIKGNSTATTLRGCEDGSLFTLSAGGADGVGYDEIMEEGVGLTKRAQLNFIGANITCVDNGGATRTDCTVSGAGGNLDLLDGSTHQDTTAGTVIRGDLITGQTATPEWTRLALGGANNIFGSDGTDAAWEAATGTASPVRANNPLFPVQVRFTAMSAPSYAAGQLFYDSTDQALSFHNDESDVTLQMGQESWVRVRNESGVTISNGAVVYIDNIASGLPRIALARADVMATSQVVGIVTHDIEDLTNGYVTAFGLVRDFDTSSFTIADRVYLSATTAGALTNTAPSDPNFVVPIGIVTVVNATTGDVLVTLSPPRATGGSGIQVTGNSISTLSSEEAFLVSGALGCGASTAGKMQTHTTPLQYCDNAGTPALQYAAYANSSGESTAAANTSVDLTTDVSGILPGANGGTNNGFLQFSGPTTTLKTWTGPDASVTLLTDNAAVTVGQGGTGLTAGTSGGVPYFNSTSTMASSALLDANELILGGGAGTAPSTPVGLGTTTTVLHGNAAGAPTFSAVVLTTDVSGILPTANGGTGQNSTATFPTSGIVTTDAGTSTFTNKTLDVEGTGNSITTVSEIVIVAAGCNNATAGPGFDIPTANAPNVTCFGADPRRFAYLDFPDSNAADTAETHFRLPTGWTGNIDLDIIWACSAATCSTNNIVATIQTVCIADTEDILAPTFNTAQTITDAGSATLHARNTASLAAITTTGCAAGEIFVARVGRDSNNGSDSFNGTAGYLEVIFTLRKTQ